MGRRVTPPDQTTSADGSSTRSFSPDGVFWLKNNSIAFLQPEKIRTGD
jgi:hypothetical protein